MAEILGINPIFLAVAITTVGLILRISLGWVKSTSKFDPKQVFSSLVIGFFGSLPIVATGLHHIPEDLDQLALFVMIIGMLATVTGIDATAKSIGKTLKKKGKIDGGV